MEHSTEVAVGVSPKDTNNFVSKSVILNNWLASVTQTVGESVPTIESESYPNQTYFEKADDLQMTLGVSKRNLAFPKYTEKHSVDFKNYFVGQKWLGHITEIYKDHFIAKLEDLMEPGTYETADFEVAEIAPDDIELFKLGAFFYWNVGRQMHGSQISNVSFIRFRRIADWSTEEIDQAADWAKEMSKKIKWE